MTDFECAIERAGRRGTQRCQRGQCESCRIFYAPEVPEVSGEGYACSGEPPLTWEDLTWTWKGRM